MLKTLREELFNNLLGTDHPAGGKSVAVTTYLLYPGVPAHTDRGIFHGAIFKRVPPQGHQPVGASGGFGGI